MDYLSHIASLKEGGHTVIVITDKQPGFIASEIERTADVLICAGQMVKDRGKHVLVIV